MLKLVVGTAAAAAALILAVPIAFLASAGMPAANCGEAPSRTVPEAYAELVEASAADHGVPAPLLAALIHAESGWDADARSHAGASGLTQLMPATARALGVTDASDPAQAIDGGARYLASQLEAFEDLELALAAYNAGPGAVRRHGGIPPLAETRAYVPRVLALTGEYGGARPSPARWCRRTPPRSSSVTAMRSR